MIAVQRPGRLLIDLRFDPCNLWLPVGSDTRVLERVGDRLVEAEAGDIRVGQEVAACLTTVIDSCPGLGSAVLVVVGERMWPPSEIGVVS